MDNLLFAASDTPLYSVESAIAWLTLTVMEIVLLTIGWMMSLGVALFELSAWMPTAPLGGGGRDGPAPAAKRVRWQSLLM